MKQLLLFALLVVASFAGCATDEHSGACCSAGAACCKDGGACCKSK